MCPPVGIAAPATKTQSPPHGDRTMNRFIPALSSAAKASMWASWTVTNPANTRPPEGASYGSVHRRGGLPVAGRHLLPARDGYYARDDPAHLEASAWAGKGAQALGLSGPVDPDTFQAILEGKVPDGPHLGKRVKDGEIEHRPGRDVTMSAPKSVSLMALIGGDERIVEAHNRAVSTTLGWIEKNAVLTRMLDGTTGAMVHVGDQKTVVATFRHDTSRNLEPPAAHSLRDRQHGAGRGQPLAHHGQRRALPPAEGDQRDLPGGAGRGRGASRLRASVLPETNDCQAAQDFVVGKARRRAVATPREEKQRRRQRKGLADWQSFVSGRTLGYEVEHEEEVAESVLRPGGWTAHVKLRWSRKIGQVAKVYSTERGRDTQ